METLCPIGQQFWKRPAVLIVTKDRLAAVPAAGQAMPTAGHFDP
ncbi:MAG TPA: hypothetical protein P5555_07995 [Candidatus Paceibacterota bacterium]|nr:hypothetical protein [Verrucomicrobiota bacterium]HRZ45116.1 hypothetical protein [Candidatus Paceibacterota bacterium]